MPPQLFPICVGGRTGFIDRSGAVVIQPRFGRLTFGFAQGLCRVQQEGKFGYVNTRGVVVVTPRYDWAERFSHGLAAVKVGAKWGYIDRQGNWVVRPRFDWTERFEGRCAVVKIGARYGLIDRSGRWVITPRFEWLGAFSDERAAAKRSGKYGFIDVQGQMVIEPRYDQVWDFSEGLARVTAGARLQSSGWRGGQWWHMDKAGKTITGPFAHAYSFSAGLAAVAVDGKYGYVDRRGQLKIQPQFDEADEFSGGLAVVGFADRRRPKRVSPPDVDALLGHLWAIKGTVGRRGYIDRQGRWRIRARFDRAGVFCEGLAAVRLNDQWGYIDRSGKLKIRARFDEAGNFTDGLARVRTGKKNGYINRTGTFIWKPTA